MLDAASIDADTLTSVLARYNEHLKDNLRELDHARYETIPDNLRKREEQSEGRSAHLTKDEVVQLVEWKLKHGTFRPKLLALVSANSASDIETITQNAFSTYGKGSEYLGEAVKQLVKLKGIGPATASLLLSVYDLVRVAFFSDELFRYLHWSKGASIDTWSIPIKYNAKEYASLNEKAQTVLERLDRKFGAVQLEKAAYVLGKERADLSHRPSPQQVKETSEPISNDSISIKEPAVTESKKTSSETKLKEVTSAQRKASVIGAKRNAEMLDKSTDPPAARRSKRPKSS